MSEKTFLLAAATVFAVVGVLHVARIALGWTAVIGGWSVPLWMSWAAAAATFGLAVLGLRFYRKHE